MTQVDTDTFAGSIADGASETLTVDATEASEVVLTVDDGTTGGTPATYDLVQRKRSGGDVGRFQFYDEETGIQYRSVVDPAFGTQFQAELTNASGGPATYEIELEARN